MQGVFKQFLFSKCFLVSQAGTEPDQRSEDCEYVLISLGKLFNIRITSGAELAEPSLIKLCSDMLGEDVPEGFYRGFPKSVLKLTSDKRFFDQIYSYYETYGRGDFSKSRHSLFEMDEDLVREAFKEEGTIKDFSIISEKEAMEKITGYVKDMLAGSRPLNSLQLETATFYFLETKMTPGKIASKDTAIKLLLTTGQMAFAEVLYLSDVLKILREFVFELKGNFDMKKLNLPNVCRKRLTKVIDLMFERGRADVGNCFEKKKIWNGLLHHIHYRPKCEEAREFVSLMRGKENRSAYSSFEKILNEEGVIAAADFLISQKGSGALLRNLHYLISRAKGWEETELLLSRIDTDNAVILLQLLLSYGSYKTGPVPRSFIFFRSNLMSVHVETEEEVSSRRSRLTEEQVRYLSGFFTEKLRTLLKGRLGKVYIDPDMAHYAVPLKESAAQGGMGVLPSGSRLSLPQGEKIRAFTYWEKVDDIDLSAFALSEDGRREEFSWRTMFDNQSRMITYSGDQTAGYDGGSEYFDVDIGLFRKMYPDYRYLVFCDNVFSSLNFGDCFCKAGYMIRDISDSGEVFEPKTVASSFRVNAPTRFVYLFGIDVRTNEFCWLNCASEFSCAVAGETSLLFLIDRFHVTGTMNLKMLFEMMAESVTEDIHEADVVVTDKPIGTRPGVEVIREYDYEKILSLIEKRKDHERGSDA